MCGERGHLAYDTDGLYCLFTGGTGHIPNIPIEAFLGEASIREDDTVEITTGPGELIIRTPEVAVKADNDAKILRLLRLMYGSEQDQASLVGKTVCLQWSGLHVPEFWGQKQTKIRGTIVGFNVREQGLDMSCRIDDRDKPIVLRPCDLAITTSVDIDLCDNPNPD